MRDQWNSKIGFMLAAVGSAVGLGNLWRFPYVAATNGGGAFLLPYFIAIITAGIPILILEYTMGDVIPLEYGDTVTCLTASGGGYGDPFERDVEKVLEDVTLGLVSVERAEKVYGVAIDSVTLTVDAKATEALRAAHK